MIPKTIFPLFLFIAALLQPLPGLADATEDVHVSIVNGPQGSHTLKGQFFVAASSGTIWEVLTDYDHMAAFVSSIKSSQRVQRETKDWLVEQVMTGKAGIFKKRIYLLLEVEEDPFRKIKFQDMSKKSFKSYRGSWKIESMGSSIQVSYELEATPAFFSPDFIAVGAFKRSVKLLLEEVRDEIAARTNTPAKNQE